MQIHGSWQIELLGDGLVGVKVFDCWNYQASVAFAKELREFVTSRSLVKWGILLSMVDGELTTPDVIPVLQELNAWSIKNGCICEANIVGFQIHSRFLESTRASSDPSEYVQKAFQSVPEACDFLSQQGFDIRFSQQALAQWLTTH